MAKKTPTNPKPTATASKEPHRHEDDVIARARRKVQRAIEDAEREHRNKLLRRRIDLATAGVNAFERGKWAEAARDYLAYLNILEDWKGVPHGGLSPSLFDPKKDIYEMLLIAAVYWDLCKLFDKTQGNEKQRDFRMFLEKFIIFSRGSPFQPLSAETLRKYVANNKCIHKAEFKNAYKLLGGGNCFIASSLIDVTEPDTLNRLRRFRDQTLSHSPLGQAFIAWYYRNGPWMADRIDTFPDPVRKVMGSSLDVLGILSEGLSRSAPAERQIGCQKN